MSNIGLYIITFIGLIALLVTIVLLLNFFVIVIMVAISEIQYEHQKRMSKKHKDKI